MKRRWRLVLAGFGVAVLALPLVGAQKVYRVLSNADAAGYWGSKSCGGSAYSAMPDTCDRNSSGVFTCTGQVDWNPIGTGTKTVTTVPCAAGCVNQAHAQSSCATSS